MPKFGIIYHILTGDGIAHRENTHFPEPVSRSALELVHTPQYVTAVLDGTISSRELRRIGLPWSRELVNRALRAIGGTLLTARLALRHQVACNTAGGTHHAHPSFGSGFCIFNDMAVAAAVLLAEKTVRRILIVDLDVHQGDGTAAAFASNRQVFTFSMHGEKNFPFRKTPGDLDIALPDGTDDDAYMARLNDVLPRLVREVSPDLVLYDAGVDVYRGDRLGRLDLTIEGIYRRDHFVLRTLAGAGVPVAAVVGGGYDSDVESLAYRHTMLHRAAREVMIEKFG
jgi:acetoin utilization deacetylase AcuC-like enzyme